jgi:hypothetical protein
MPSAAVQLSIHVAIQRSISAAAAAVQLSFAAAADPRIVSSSVVGLLDKATSTQMVQAINKVRPILEFFLRSKSWLVSSY